MSMSMQIQGPNDEAASVPMPTLRRKVAMRTFPWLLRATDLNLVTLPLPATLPLPLPLPLPPVIKAPPQDEDLPPVAKRPRLERSDSTDAVVHDDASLFDIPDVITVAVAVTPITDDNATATPPAAPFPKTAKAKRPRVALCKWTPDEDAKLTDAVKIFGNAWIRVAELVDGRTNNQCRKRWVDNLAPATGSCQIGKWTREEDAHLATAFKQFGNEWASVATLVPGRTNIQCRQRWARGLDPDNGGPESGEIKARKWTPDEDAKLADAAAKFGNEWTAVAALVPDRTNAQCRQRWVNRLNPTNGAKCRKWSPPEDAMLAGAVGQFGNDWTTVASQIDGRTNIQCRQRWLHSLDHAVGVKTGKWTNIEDTKLLQGVMKFGSNWIAVAATIPMRTNGQCCQRWLHSSVNPSAVAKCRRWTSEEDAKLIGAMQRFGNDWTTVAALVPDRTNVQCGKRWSRAFDPDNSDKGQWRPEEDAKLTEAVKSVGNDWPAVAALVPCRGNVQCRQRWLHNSFPAQAKWTSEEDIKLIEAVGECGDDWTAVAALVPARTDEECGKRWARAFDAHNGDKETFDSNNGDKVDPALWWTPEEDAELTEAVKKFGNDWTKIALVVNSDRTNDQCRHRWVGHLDLDRGMYYAVEQEQVHYVR